MLKAVRLGTKINEAVSEVELALSSSEVTLRASGNAIAKAITISEIVKRNAGEATIHQTNSLTKLFKEDSEDKSREVEFEEGEWKDSTTKPRAKRFEPCLEIVLRKI